ncbi:hypothetical protein D4740_03720 [Actinomyces sp. 2119]|uniref:Prokaryotic membrane lipoprotein lipid attachment site profile n=1 Tax=Actinomyces lilanjuaniae TaxID=2321394 RepID=A0ABN5PQ19_9ACTO|nr:MULTISPECIES: hypothetical protein [Actinomyces]AYD90503.1 hypothetical protein D5R93_11755 [Actinomyces lilanjuaniae]RJF44045.1 hypothetical protein D4740_03720 [Actinomyces sp. 2119]
MRARIRTALAVGAVSTALALAGCAGNSSDEETTAADEETTAAQTEESTGTEETAEGSEDSAASADSTEDAESPEAVIPEGYQEVEAPTAGISLAVPEGWEDAKAYSDEQLQAIAEAQGSDLDTYQQMLAELDLAYRAAEPDENGFVENVNVESGVYSNTETPTEEEVTSFLAQQGAELAQYGTVETPNGEAATGAYSIPDNPAQGEVLIAPTSDGGYAVITVTTSSAERTEELVQDIAGSIG